MTTGGAGHLTSRAQLVAACCLLVLGLTLVLSAARRADGATRAHASIGFEPTSLGIATDAAGHVYLSNPQRNGKVQEYSPDGKLLAELGSFGTSELPRAITVGPDADLYVAAGNLRKVVVLDPHGTEITQWSLPQAGEVGRGIAVDGGGNVLVAENGAILRYGPTGNPLPSWGTGPGQAVDPYEIAAAPSGLLYATNTYENKLDAFDSSGALAYQWGEFGSAPGQVNWPFGIAVAPSGDVYIADTANARVQEFTASGGFVRAFGHGGEGPGHFETATGIAVDPAGFVYVADSGEEYPDLGGARVEKFTAEGQFVTQWREEQKPPPGRPRLVERVLGSTKNTAVFRFSSGASGAEFQCRLAGAGVPGRLESRWRGCSSPRRFKHLRPGHKVFRVRAVARGRPGPAAHYAWTVGGSRG